MRLATPSNQDNETRTTFLLLPLCPCYKTLSCTNTHFHISTTIYSGVKHPQQPLYIAGGGKYAEEDWGVLSQLSILKWPTLTFLLLSGWFTPSWRGDKRRGPRDQCRPENQDADYVQWQGRWWYSPKIVLVRKNFSLRFAKIGYSFDCYKISSRVLCYAFQRWLLARRGCVCGSSVCSQQESHPVFVVSFSVQKNRLNNTITGVSVVDGSKGPLWAAQFTQDWLGCARK